MVSLLSFLTQHTIEADKPRDRVLCVLTTGQAWQFKPYKWQDPRTLFRHGQLNRTQDQGKIADNPISQRSLFPVEQRAFEPRRQRLECHRNEGMPLVTYSPA